MPEKSKVTPKNAALPGWRKCQAWYPTPLNTMEDFLGLEIVQKQIVCPKHGTHKHYISSNIEGYEGNWCMLCWLESLGPSLPLVETEAQ